MYRTEVIHLFGLQTGFVDSRPDPLQETFLYIEEKSSDNGGYYPQNGGIAQLARAPALQAGGPGFESPCLQKK